MNEEESLKKCKQIRRCGIKEKTSVLGGKKVTYFKGKNLMNCLFRNKDRLDVPLNNLQEINQFCDE
mgnify:FL=1